MTESGVDNLFDAPSRGFDRLNKVCKETSGCSASEIVTLI